ncbi:ADM [Anabas testudineus]|uniref:Adrenomedullin n=1 Tax=Anabas testudineus TaxID=64144 RepID=A0A3Q1H1R1_ANATE|nr:ADM [Anabas testudineus]
MRLTLHTIICCCLFTMVLPLIKGATEELNSSLKKRLKIWLHNHMKRDLSSSSVLTTSKWSSDIGSQRDKNTKTVSAPSSFDVNSRPRRSISPKTGCNLGTCVYHDLLHDVYTINIKPKDVKAPPNKIGSNGYGRRRRSLLGITQLALQTGRQRRSTEAGQPVRRHRSTCTVA